VKILAGLVFAVMRGMEMPLLALIYAHVFDAFNGDRNHMLHNLTTSMIYFICLGVAVMLTQLASVRVRAASLSC
jgi:hypothetical protein